MGFVAGGNWNVDNDSCMHADVTLVGRSFLIRGPTTGKAQLAT